MAKRIWIHKNGTARVDKRVKQYKSQSKANGVRKRTKK